MQQPPYTCSIAYVANNSEQSKNDSTILVTIYDKTIDGASGPVALSSSLKQSSLCPEETFAVFTCIAIGTDLTWLIGEIMMSYNANARVGTLRSSQESDITATLLRKVIIRRENGYGHRLSVLTVNIRPLATENLIVQCHNGSSNQARSLIYLPKIPELPDEPRILNSIMDGNTLSMMWSAPLRSERDISHYSIQVDNNPPLLVKNTSATIPINSKFRHTIHLRAVDRCGQIGAQKLLDLPASLSTSSTSSTAYGQLSGVTPLKVSSQGLKNTGINKLALLCIILSLNKYLLK